MDNTIQTKKSRTQREDLKSKIFEYVGASKKEEKIWEELVENIEKSKIEKEEKLKKEKREKQLEMLMERNKLQVDKVIGGAFLQIFEKKTREERKIGILGQLEKKIKNEKFNVLIN